MTMPGRDRRDVTIDVTIASQTRGADQAAGALGRVDKAADKAGDSLQGMTTRAERLNAEIELTTSKIAELDDQLSIVGNDKGTRKELRAQESWLRDLQKVAKRMEAADGGGIGVTIGSTLGTSVGQGMSSGILDSLAKIPAQAKGAGMVAGVGIAAGMTPFIGAAIAGAVTGAVGAGGIAGGIAAAARDPLVKSAAATFSTSIASEFTAAGRSFVEPTIEALGILERGFSDLELGDSFQKVAPYVTVLADGIADLGREFMPGFNDALDEAGPALGVLADELPMIGRELGGMVKTLAESDGALEGFRTVLLATGDVIRGAGVTIGWLGDRYHDLINITAEVSGALEDVPWLGAFSVMNDRAEAVANGGLRQMGQRMGETTAGVKLLAQEGLDILAASAAAASEKMFDLNAEMNNLWDISMNAAEASDDHQAALDDLTQSLKDNGTTINASTEAGRANRDAFRDAIKTAQDMRQANIDNGMTVAAANVLYRNQITAIEGIAAKAKVTKAELENIAGDYQINVNFHTSGRLPNMQSIKFERFAAGGDTPKDAPFIAGEDGAELIFPNGRQQYVANAQETRRLLSSAGGGVSTMGSAPQSARPVFVNGDALAQLFWRWFRNEVDAQGGTIAVLGIRE